VRKATDPENARTAGNAGSEIIFHSRSLLTHRRGFLFQKGRGFAYRHYNDIRPNMTVNFEKPRILIVDDTRHIRDLIRLIYDEYDIDLIEAVNGRDAVEMARACTPDLILLDIQMPVMNGYEAAVILKNDKALKDTPLLFMSGLEFSDVPERLSGLYDGYLSKPFQEEDLIKATMQWLPNIKYKTFMDTNTETVQSGNHDCVNQLYFG